MTDLPIIDRERLAKVCMGKPEMALEFIDLLIEEVTPAVAALPAALAAGDTVAVREGAHSVKGMAGNIGAARLQAAALTLERSAAEASDASILSANVADLAAALSELRTERETVT